MKAPLPDDERLRQAALLALDILETERSVEFDIYPELATQLFAAPIAAVSLIDRNRQWFKASVGLEMTETPREQSFCAHAILKPNDVLYVPDATKDPRFADNPLVTGEFGLRFYAGAPVVGPSGHAIGAMCVIDREPRIATPDSLIQLKKLAIGVGSAVKRHASERELHRQKNSQTLMQTMLASVFQKVDAAVAIVSAKGNVLIANAAYTNLLGYSAAELARLTLKDLSSPDCLAEMANAHARQSATGDLFEMDAVFIRKGGEHVSVHLTSRIVHRAEMQPFRVVTLRPSSSAGRTPEPASRRTVAVAGCVQLLGLEPIRAAYGARWDTVRGRLMLAAESILKRRLSETDIYSRTDNDGFSIWFRHGTEEENADRVARIGREIRVMLLGELGEETTCSVGAYTQTAEIADPNAPSSEVMQALSRRLAEGRRQAERDAQDLLESVMRDQPREDTPISSNAGQPVQSAFTDLPRALHGRFAGAMSLVGGPEADADGELFRLGLVVQSIMEDAAQGRSSVRFIRLQTTLFTRRRSRERFIEQWKTLSPVIGQRLFVMLSGISQEITQMRLAEAARLLQPLIKGVGVFVEQIDQLPFNTPSPFGMVGLSSETAAGLKDAKLSAFVSRLHEAKMRVLLCLAAGQSHQRWRALGIDLFTAA